MKEWSCSSLRKTVIEVLGRRINLGVQMEYFMLEMSITNACGDAEWQFEVER